MMRHIRNLFVSWPAGLLAILGLVLASGCETTGPQRPPTGGGTNKLVHVGLTEEYLRVGEQLTIEFLDINPAQQIQLNVPADGDVNLLLGQKVHVLNKTVAALQNEIHGIYVPKLYRRLTVNIKREVRFIYVRGEVKSAGRFPHIGQMTVLKAISAAGGFSIYAAPKKVEVTRSNGQTERVDCERARKDPKYDPPLYPDDQINVPLRIY